MSSIQDTDVIIEFRNVSKVFRTYPTPRHRLMQMLTRNTSRYVSETHALHDVSFTLRKGERLGIVGENGSGKSTLLKVLCGVLSPTSGQVRVRGRISALLELGAGFNPELTGMENVRQYCELQGMSNAAITYAIPDIEQFAELGDAIHHPVKTYSSGMAVRLGFSCAVYTNPDILIVDEALSVGDAYFQNKCMNKIKSMLESGITFLYVTHAADSVRNLCTKGIWLEKGKLKLAGLGSEVSGEYQKSIYEKMIGAQSLSSPTADLFFNLPDTTDRHQKFRDRVAPLRTGSGEARIIDIEVLDPEGESTDTLDFLDTIRIRVTYAVVAEKFDADLTVTVGITDSYGTQIVHANSAEAGIHLKKEIDGSLNAVEFRLHPSLCPGNYGVMAGIGKFFRSPHHESQWVLQWVTDACIGGSRFNILYSGEAKRHNLWGLVFAKPEFEHMSLKNGMPLQNGKTPDQKSIAVLPRYAHIKIQALPIAPFDFFIHTEGDEIISRDIATNGVWEPFETAVISQLVRKGDFFLDLGANIGWFSVLASILTGPEGRVLSFEPDDRNFALLDMNLKLNSASHCRRLKLAVSDKTSAGTLYRSPNNLGDHRLFSDGDESREQCHIETITLVEALKDEPNLPDIVKSDTQGSEAKILRGAMALFEAGWRPVIIMEYWPFGLTRSGDDPLELWQTLKSLDYRIFEVAEYNPTLVEADENRVRSRLTSDLHADNWLFTNFLCLPPGCDRINPADWQKK